ncbi:Hypothetical predicted protein [Mytilus galloprovincialis]|uniref:CCHC-type domain-containing protein n=1 Tax=Mytilus galloprovincialis TaxID=29158 RepID=A0A8B6CXC0_MYTGA|nr:Hypothetical predicted protein [Mytilus galloprovincialis]
MGQVIGMTTGHIFEACSSINGWDNLEKGLYLAASLRGQAQGVLGDLSDDKKSHFDQLVRSLEERFAPPNQSELYREQLKERKQKASETLPGLGQTIRQLVNKAYPTAPGEVKETLAKENFLDALINTEMRIKIKQSRPPDLNSAICLAVELETFYKAEKQFEVGKAHLRVVDNNEQVVRESESHDRLSDKIEGMLEAFNDQLANMRKELDEFKNKANMSGPVERSKLLCYNCGKPGHMARNCNAHRNRRQNNQGSPGPSVRRTNNRSGVIAGLSVEGILGLDFLQTNGCKVDLGNKVMERDNQHIPLLLQGKLGVYRVTVKDKVSIAPRSEVVIQGEELNYDSAVQVTGIIEPSEEFLDRGKALVAKSVVMSDKSVPVRLFNISKSVQVLNVGTVVGNLSGAEVVSQVDNHKDYALNNELEKLLDRSSENLGHGQKDKVTELLLEFKHLFLPFQIRILDKQIL